MRKLGQYLLAAIGVTVLSLTIANVTVRASGDCHVEVADEYTCYATGSDANYCYYDCYCKVGDSACDAALTRDGFESY